MASTKQETSFPLAEQKKLFKKCLKMLKKVRIVFKVRFNQKGYTFEYQRQKHSK